IKTFDAGAWYDPEFAHQSVPSLGDVIARFRNRQTTRHHPLGFVIELKTVRGSGGSLADSVTALLQSEQFTDRAVVISFDAVALRELRAANKHLPTGLLYSEEKEESPVVLAREIGAHAIFPRQTCVTARLVSAAHKAGRAVASAPANTENQKNRVIAR